MAASIAFASFGDVSETVDCQLLLPGRVGFMGVLWRTQLVLRGIQTEEAGREMEIMAASLERFQASMRIHVRGRSMEVKERKA